MTSLRYFVLFLALFGLTATASAQQQPAAQGGGTATRFLQQKHQAVERVLRRPAKNATAVERRNTEVGRMLGDLLDYDALARESLGTHWQARSEAERREFVTLLRQLVERSYQDNLNRTLQFTVRYDGEQPAAGGAVVVRTSARSRTNRRAPAVEIHYTMRRAGNAWKVTDVSTDGVSLVRNYRNQFTRIVQRDGWADLIRRMRQRLSGTAEL